MDFKRAYNLLIKPKSANSDGRRREFILNVILCGSLVLSLVALVTVLMNEVALRSAYTGESPLMAIISVIFFSLLLVVSRVGKYKISGYILVLLYLLAAFYTLYRWGISLTEGVLILALTVVLASILLGTRGGAVLTVLATAGLCVLGYLQQKHLVSFSTSWMKTPGNLSDAVAFSLTLGVITLISWLSNREVERSLARAIRSEAELLRQRDLLEEKVQERTRALEISQREQIMQLSRFAEFGRLTSGMVHELVTPLTTVSLNLEQMHSRVDSAKLRRAMDSTKRMEKYIDAARKQLQNQPEESTFSLSHEISSVLAFLEPLSKSRKVQLEFSEVSSPTLTGSPIKFHQLVTNLVSNAIAAYGPAVQAGSRKVVVTLETTRNWAVVKVTDWGKGVPPEFIDKIFEPFFTLKPPDEGMGIGLSLVKDVAERNFGGNVSAISNKDGTVFTVRLPIKRKD